MEEKKNQQNKFQKVRINPIITFENVRSKLELALQNKEYTILVKGCSQLRDVFTLINNKLCSQLILNQLTIQFEQIKCLKFEETIYQLNDLKQITNLSLNFQEGVSYDLSQQNQSLSDSLIHSFQHLTHLKIHLSCKLFNNNASIFKLYNFYRESSMLFSIDFMISHYHERSTIFYDLFEGIRFVKNLKSLSIKNHLSKVKSCLIVDILEDELSDNSSIQEFHIDFGYQTLITNPHFQKMGRILKSIQNLEKLTISAYSSIEKEQLENIGMERDISELKNLKSLSLNFDRQFQFKYVDLVFAIASMDSLENVSLDIHISKKGQINNDLKQFVKSLSEIKALTKLSITFSYDFPIYTIESIEFMSLLYPLQKLIYLSIYLSSMREIKYQPEQLEIDHVNFREVINRLQVFKFKKNAELNYKQDNNINSVLEYVQGSSNLDELVIEFNNYFSEYDSKQTVILSDFLENKTKLKTFFLNFDKHCVLDINQMLCIYQRLSNNPQLKSINISVKNDSKIRGLDLKELSYSLTQLECLNSLYLSFSSQMESDEGLSHFSLILCQLKSLRALNIEFSKENLSPNTLNTFIANISQIPKLKQLALRIKGQSFESTIKEKSFGDSFQFPLKLSSLEITLKIPQMEYKNLKNIFKQTSQLKSVQNLVLCFPFQVTFEDCIELKEDLSKLKLLHILTLHNFSFQLLHLLRLFDELLFLSEINFMDEYRDVCCIVKANKKTKIGPISGEMNENIELKIQNDNFFNNKFYEQEHASRIIPFTMQNLILLTKLKLFFFENNYIGSDYSSLLFQNLRTLSNLEYLKVHIQENNLIGTECINILGETLLELPQLRKLSFILNEESNNIRWGDCTFYSHSLGRLKQLESLEIVIIFQYKFNQFEVNQEFGDQERKYQEGIILSLFKSISDLKNLHTLEIITNFQRITQQISDQFRIACLSLQSNLKVLSLSFEHIQINCLKQIKQSILLLENLYYLKLHFQRTNDLLKLKRLVRFSKLSSYYPSYDYV